MSQEGGSKNFRGRYATGTKRRLYLLYLFLFLIFASYLTLSKLFDKHCDCLVKSFFAASSAGAYLTRMGI
jgi:hypothetical protein